MAPDKGYQIQTHEVTWGELAEASTVPDAGVFERPKWLPRNAKQYARLPATNVPWVVAQAFCRGLGGDLPSEAEWEWVARGPDDNYWPWGRAAFGAAEVHIFADKVPVVAVMTSKLDRTVADPPVFDLLGNAREWTRDPWRAADPSAMADPQALMYRAVRGWPLRTGDEAAPAEGSTYRSRHCADPACLPSDGQALHHVGFRCVRSGG
jgi:formylglycine-generating enzyme required for sulfatase activity